ncbi:MAG: signal peptide peptidase SppA [Bacteroidales bacterium]|nr:signal peptide peptidase SppA [Bacteroidales bacterium]
MNEKTKRTKASDSGASFVKIMLASAVGFVGIIILVSVFSTLIIGSLVASASKETKLEDNTVLVMKLNSPIVEQQQDDFNLNLDFMDLASASPMGLNKILDAIEKAKNDEKIKGIFLDITIVQASFSELHEIKMALEDFKTAGKFIVAHSDVYTHNSYYLASIADKIYLTPTGTFLWKGFASQVMYYKGTLDKLEIEPEIIRHGKFKSAVEPFLMDTMSKENRLQIEKFLYSLWDQYVDEIATARNLDKDALNLYADSLLINSSEKAVALNLIDQEKFRNDVLDEIKDLAGLDADKKLRTISLEKYIETNSDEIDGIYMEIEEMDDSPKIAIIYAEGDIISGKSTDGSMGSITISEAIRKVANDESVKAIVFRVNSPGGSALASEVILHEIELAKAKKPVVVSMGKYAASGGYYISCYADKIYAEPYTLTGSIGVFGMLFNAEKLLNNKLGIKINVVKTNENADFGGVFRPLSATERQYLQFQIEDIYDKFISHVALGRGMTKKEVDEIGQGRVWAAPDALEIGLIDEIGGINDALKTAAELSGLDEYKIIEYPKVMNFFDRIFEQYETKLLVDKLGSNYDLYKKLKQLQNMQGIQARMTFDVEVY